MVIDNKYNIGDLLYLITDEDQLLFMCTGYIIGPQSILYRISSGAREVEAYDFELTKDKNLVII